MARASGRGRKPSAKAAAGARLPRKLVAIEPDLLQALEWLARDRMQSFGELAEEAFTDVLKKHHRPVTLKEALKQSARLPANDTTPPDGAAPPPKRPRQAKRTSKPDRKER